MDPHFCFSQITATIHDDIQNSIISKCEFLGIIPENSGSMNISVPIEDLQIIYGVQSPEQIKNSMHIPEELRMIHRFLRHAALL